MMHRRATSRPQTENDHPAAHIAAHADATKNTGAAASRPALHQLVPNTLVPQEKKVSSPKLLT